MRCPFGLLALAAAILLTADRPLLAVPAEPLTAGAAVTGQIVSDGLPPPVPGRPWAVDPKSTGVRYVYVWLTPVKAGDKMRIHTRLKDVEPREVVLDMTPQRFDPPAVALREGQVLRVRTVGGQTQAFKWESTRTKGCQMIPAGKEYSARLDAEKGPLVLSCACFAPLAGTARVFDHPYFALTDSGGTFKIDSVPPGKYRLMIWHPSVGWLGGAAGKNGREIALEEGKTLDQGKLKMAPPRP